MHKGLSSMISSLVYGIEALPDRIYTEPRRAIELKKPPGPCWAIRDTSAGNSGSD